MSIAIGVVLVLIAIAFVLLPLFRKSRDVVLEHVDPATLRAGIYRQILDAELDARLGKLDDTEFLDLRARLLRDAALLIAAGEDQPMAESDIQARVEDEIAAARAALQRGPSMGGVNA